MIDEKELLDEVQFTGAGDVEDYIACGGISYWVRDGSLRAAARNLVLKDSEVAFRLADKVSNTYAADYLRAAAKILEESEQIEKKKLQAEEALAVSERLKSQEKSCPLVNTNL